METKIVPETPDESPGGDKKRVSRSRAYPIRTVNETIYMVQKIQDSIGDSDFKPLEEIAPALGKAPASIRQEVSTAVQYGLLLLKSKIGYKVNGELMKKLQLPLNEGELRSDKIEVFKTPSIYSDLIEKINEGKVPSESGLRNLLIRDEKFALNEGAAEIASSIFLLNIKDLGIVNSAGYLDFGFNKPSKSEEKIDLITPVVEIKGNEDSVSFEQNMESLKILITGKDRRAVLHIPQDYTAKDLKIISEYCNLLALRLEN